MNVLQSHDLNDGTTLRNEEVYVGIRTGNLPPLSKSPIAVRQQGAATSHKGRMSCPIPDILSGNFRTDLLLTS